MSISHFKFEHGDKVVMSLSREHGEIIGRADFSTGIHQYLVRYIAGDGRQVEAWFTVDAIEAMPGSDARKSEDSAPIGAFPGGASNAGFGEPWVSDLRLSKVTTVMPLPDGKTLTVTVG